MMRLTVIALSLVAATAQVPDSLKPPGTEAVVLKALGKGKQVYICTATGWVLDRPEASLFDENGKPIGKHYKGRRGRLRTGAR